MLYLSCNNADSVGRSLAAPPPLAPPPPRSSRPAAWRHHVVVGAQELGPSRRFDDERARMGWTGAGYSHPSGAANRVQLTSAKPDPGRA